MPVENYLIVHKEQPLAVSGPNGGAEMATRRLAQFLVRAGKQVVVAGNLPSGDQQVEGVSYWNYGEEYNLTNIFCRTQERFSQFHLVAVGRAQPLFFLRDSAAVVSRSLILHDRHGHDAGLSLGIISKNVNNIFAVSDAHREELIGAGAKPELVQTIWNGVDTEVFSRGDPSKRDPYKLVFAGALVQDKGLHLLLQAYGRLKRKFPSLTLDIYGSASLWGRTLIFDEEKIESQLPGVKFKGAQDQRELARGFQSAALCVVPSIWFETFGLVAIEAQATGCPVVVFKNGGLGEGVIQGQTGKIITEISVETLTSELTTLLSDRTEVLRLGEAAASHVRMNFTWEKVVDRVARFCEQNSATPVTNIPSIQTPLGVISTWNQQCGLATYAKYLFSELDSDSVVIFAEDISEGKVAPDENNVVRCWQRRGHDLRQLEREVLERGIRLLHLNFHDHSFIDHQYLLPFLSSMRENGIKIVSHLHTTFAPEARFSAFVRAVDQIIVHSPESRLQVIAVGAIPEAVHVLPHGILDISRPQGSERNRIRQRYMPKTEAYLISTFGFIQPHKGIEAVVEAVAHLTSRGIASYGLIAGRVNDAHPHAHSYCEQVKLHAKNLGVSDRVHFSEQFLSETEVAECLTVSDIVIMNYGSQYFEASGACARALGAGALVMTSLSPNFVQFGDAVWRLTAGFTAGVSAEVLLSNAQVAAELGRNRERYVAQVCWSEIGKKLIKLYHQWGFDLSPVVAKPVHEVVDRGEQEPLKRETVIVEIEKAEEQLRSGNLQGARKALNQIVEHSPHEERALRALGTIELTDNNLYLARSYFSSALELQPMNAKTLGGLGMCALNEGKLQEAHDYLLKSVAHDSSFILGLKNLIFTGFALEKYQDLERGIRSYLRTHPEDDDIQYCLAGCLYKQKDWQGARIVLDSILERTPGHENARELIERICAETLPQDPEPESASIDLRIFELEEAKRQRLLDAVYRGLDEIEKEELSPRQLEYVFILRAETLTIDGGFSRAENLFSQILEANPSSGRAMSGLGAIAIGREKLDEAKKWFSAALVHHDRTDIALAGLGVCCQWHGQSDGAWEYYKRALMVNPENEQALYGVVQIGMMRREFEVVEQYLRAYLALRPATLDHIYSLAGCLYAQKRYGGALDELEKLLLFEPLHVNGLELKEIIASQMLNSEAHGISTHVVEN